MKNHLLLNMCYVEHVLFHTSIESVRIVAGAPGKETWAGIARFA